MKLKTLARLGAGMSFAAFFLGGILILGMSGFRITGEYLLATVIGLFLVGTAFFAGGMLWLAAEKWAGKPPGQGLDESERPWPKKIIFGVIGAIVGVLVVLPLIRMMASVFTR